VTHEVDLEWVDGRCESVLVSEIETILEAAESAGVSLPFGCLTGACVTCVGRLLEGDVRHQRPPRALKDRQLADGYVLLCITEPKTDCRIRVGADVQTELVRNPWK
jgi:ferredoxin